MKSRLCSSNVLVVAQLGPGESRVGPNVFRASLGSVLARSWLGPGGGAMKSPEGIQVTFQLGSSI